MKAIGIIFSVAAGVGLLVTTSMAQAQGSVASPTPPKQLSITKFADNLKRRLESLGYSNVTLTPSDKGIKGVAVKGDRRVEIILDEKGQLRVRDPA